MAGALPTAGNAPQHGLVHARHQVLADVDGQVAVRGEAEHQGAAVVLGCQLEADDGGGLHLLTDTRNGHRFGDLFKGALVKRQS